MTFLFLDRLGPNLAVVLDPTSEGKWRGLVIRKTPMEDGVFDLYLAGDEDPTSSGTWDECVHAVESRLGCHVLERDLWSRHTERSAFLLRIPVALKERIQSHCARISSTAGAKAPVSVSQFLVACAEVCLSMVETPRGRERGEATVDEAVEADDISMFTSTSPFPQPPFSNVEVGGSDVDEGDPTGTPISQPPVAGSKRPDGSDGRVQDSAARDSGPPTTEGRPQNNPFPPRPKGPAARTPDDPVITTHPLPPPPPDAEPHHPDPEWEESIIEVEVKIEGASNKKSYRYGWVNAAVPGLVVNRIDGDPLGSKKCYVTHVASGMSVGDPMSSTKAKATAEALAKLFDWRKPADQITEEEKAKIRAILKLSQIQPQRKTKE